MFLSCKMTLLKIRVVRLRVTLSRQIFEIGEICKKWNRITDRLEDPLTSGSLQKKCNENIGPKVLAIYSQHPSPPFSFFSWFKENEVHDWVAPTHKVYFLSLSLVLSKQLLIMNRLISKLDRIVSWEMSILHIIFRSAGPLVNKWERGPVSCLPEPLALLLFFLTLWVQFYNFLFFYIVFWFFVLVYLEEVPK